MIWKIKIEKRAKDDLQFFRKNNKSLYIKCFDLIQDILENPERGIGKPEHLKYFGENIWSRRVDLEHRLVYIIDYKENTIYFISCRFHYRTN